MSDKETAQKWLDSRGLGDLSLYWPTNKPIPQIDYKSGEAQPTLTQLMAEFAEECTAQAPTTLLGKIVRLVDEVTHKEQIGSPLWELGCAIYDDLCDQHGSETLKQFGEATPQGTPTPKQGSWPANCPQRIFVEGAAWWQFHSQGSTMFQSEREDAEAEAVRIFGTPSPTECPQCGSKDFWTVLPKCHGGKAHKWHSKGK